MFCFAETLHVLVLCVVLRVCCSAKPLKQPGVSQILYWVANFFASQQGMSNEDFW